MSVRFVIGRAGTGKTEHIRREIVEELKADPLGPLIVWLLPRQATFSAERQLACSSGLAGFARCRVLSFDTLARDILAECRGGAVPEVTGLGRQMILAHLLRKHSGELRFFATVAQQPGLAARLDEMFAEFDQCHREPKDLADLATKLAQADAAQGGQLARKMGDFALLYTAYRDFLGQEHVDPHRRLSQVLQCLADSKRFRGASIYVDGFLEFAENERQTLAALAGVCGRMEIALLRDVQMPDKADEYRLFHKLEETYRRLREAFAEAGVEVGPDLVLTKPRRFASPAVAAIESGMFAKPRAHAATADVEFIEAPERRAEVAACARRIGDLVRSGLRLRDIAVLVRDLDEYHELIEAAFSEQAIPFFADRRRTAAHHPLLVLTRSVLAIARTKWGHEAVMTLAKSGLAGLSGDHADRLENYVLLHRICGEAWTRKADWDYARKLRAEDEEPTEFAKAEARRMDNLRRGLVNRLQPLLRESEKTLPIRAWANALYKVFDRFRVRQALEQWITEASAGQRHEQRGEHERVWQEMGSLLDQLVDLLGDIEVTLDSFAQTLESGLEQFDLALTPPTVDQVLVGQVDRTRTATAEVVFVLGLADGQFPRLAREDAILSDGERRKLETEDLLVRPDSQRRLLEENLFGYIAFTRAAKQMVVSRSLADESRRPLAPSTFWQRLRNLFPENNPDLEPRESELDAARIASPRQLITALMRWARGAKEDAGEPWAALYSWLAQRPVSDDAMDRMRARSWRALAYDNSAAIDGPVAQALFGSPLKASVTRIESFASCPFRHFAQYGLRLKEREEPEVTELDLGNLCHEILQKLVRGCIEKTQDFCELSAEEAKATIDTAARQVAESLRGELLLDNARNEYVLKRIKQTLEQVVQAQREALKRGGFRPWAAEKEYGENADLPALELTTPKGHKVLLRGKIDRVDTLADEVTCAVIDYKLSDRKLSLAQVYHGLALQLLTYMLVLRGNKKMPVAAFYAKLQRGLESCSHPDGAPEPDSAEFALREKPRGILDVKYADALDGSPDRGGWSDVYGIYFNRDGTCGNINKSDVVTSKELEKLLEHVERKICEMADQLIGGSIAIHPYRMSNQSPCSYCPYRALCRFDTTVNKYHFLPVMKREAVLTKLVDGEAK